MADLAALVNKVLVSQFDSGLQAVYDKWSVSEPAFVQLYKDRYGKLKFFRGLLPAGWPGNSHTHEISLRYHY